MQLVHKYIIIYLTQSQNHNLISSQMTIFNRTVITITSSKQQNSWWDRGFTWPDHTTIWPLWWWQITLSLSVRHCTDWNQQTKHQANRSFSYPELFYQSLWCVYHTHLHSTIGVIPCIKATLNLALGAWCVYAHTVGIPGTKAYKGSGWLKQKSVLRVQSLPLSDCHSLWNLPSSIPALSGEKSLAAHVRSSPHFPVINEHKSVCLQAFSS